jgi:hypothetical protein
MNNMFRLLLYMHHIAFTPHALYIWILTHTYAYTLGHVEPKSEVQAEQAQVEAITYHFLSKASPDASHPILDFYF